MITILKTKEIISIPRVPLSFHRRSSWIIMLKEGGQGPWSLAFVYTQTELGDSNKKQAGSFFLSLQLVLNLLEGFTCQKPRHYHTRGKTLAGRTPEKFPAPKGSPVALVRCPGRALTRGSALDEDKLDVSSCRAEGLLGSPQISEPAPDRGGAWLDLHDPVMDHVLLRITFTSSEGNFLLPAP